VGISSSFWVQLAFVVNSDEVETGTHLVLLYDKAEVPPCALAPQRGNSQEGKVRTRMLGAWHWQTFGTSKRSYSASAMPTMTKLMTRGMRMMRNVVCFGNRFTRKCNSEICEIYKFRRSAGGVCVICISTWAYWYLLLQYTYDNGALSTINER
jgi:hypothetical protein